jgi:hypothetical protein
VIDADQDDRARLVAIGLTEGPRVVLVSEPDEPEDEFRARCSQVVNAGRGHLCLWTDGVYSWEQAWLEYPAAMGQYLRWMFRGHLGRFDSRGYLTRGNE